MPAPLLYVVVPWFNENPVVDAIVPRFCAVLGELVAKGLVGAESRLLFVDDGSDDGTLDLLKAWAARETRIEVLALGRNVGQQAALVEGLRRARAAGAAVVVTMDCDGQDDPAAVENMVRAFHAGAEVVYGVRNDRTTDGFFRRSAALLFYRIMGGLGSKTVYNHAEFRLMSAAVVDAVVAKWRPGMFLRGLAPTLGFSEARVEYRRQARLAGRSHYGLGQLLALSLRAMGEALGIGRARTDRDA